MSVVCDTCKGKGHVFAHVNYGYDEQLNGCNCENKDIPCISCGGSGVIDPAQIERAKIGKLLRDARMARRETLFHAAQRLKIGSAHLSEIEFGRRSVDEVPALAAELQLLQAAN